MGGGGGGELELLTRNLTLRVITCGREQPKKSDPMPRPESKDAAAPGTGTPPDTEAAKRFFDAMWDLPAAKPTEPEKARPPPPPKLHESQSVLSP